MASNINVYVRVRPSARPGAGFEAGPNSVTFETGRQQGDAEVNNNKQSHSFRFSGVLGMQISQEDVLQEVAKPVVEDVLKGLNGTIFAYGQTGSGKTYTVTGGDQKFEDRGLIPRTLAYMFERFRGSSTQYKMYISYLEIYQDRGYDLLRQNPTMKLEDLPQVYVQHDKDGDASFPNLSINVATSQEEALNLLFWGDTNRVVAETSMNDASTRSHCIFIIMVQSESPGSDVVRRSKLHLVDLAGSERPSQTGVTGKLLKEATSINQSLFYLERVIVALHAKAQGQQMHVPYRDSLMTLFLRDSLGGNCKTTMIACVAAEAANTAESISTCRFAQRVAMIKNNAHVNEELDPNLLMARLKREVVDLRKQISIAQGGDGDGNPLGNEDYEDCKNMVMQYAGQRHCPEKQLACGSMRHMQACFRILRDLCRGAGGGIAGSPAAPRGDAALDPAVRAALEAEAQKLRCDIAQRDQEISMMLRWLTKRGSGLRETLMADSNHQVAQQPSDQQHGGPAVAKLPTPREAPGSTPLAVRGPPAAARAAPNGDPAGVACLPGSPAAAAAPGGAAAAAPPSTAASPSAVAQARPSRTFRVPGEQPKYPMPPVSEAAELLLDQSKAWDIFMSTVYQKPSSTESNTQQLKERITCAKQLGEEATAVRTNISGAKTRLERLRTERAMTAAGGASPAVEDGPEEQAEIQELARLKVEFRDKTGELRRVKEEIDTIKQMLDQGQLRARREFETWYAALRKNVSAQLGTLDDQTKKALYDRIKGISG